MFRWIMPEGIFLKPCENPTVYLTFDDGPIPEVTPWVLDQLDRFGIKATFFMVGDNVRKYPDIFREVLRRGHSVGNHTMHHLNGVKKRSDKFVADVREAADLIDSGLFRPPHGWMRGLQTLRLKKRFKIVMYDVVTRDYSKWLNADEVFETVKRLTRNGSIIVFHDSLKSWPRLKKALPASLEWLKSKGYSFATLE